MNSRSPIQVPNPTLRSKDPQVPKIQLISDKKTEKDKTRSYLVTYCESDRQVWASEKYLCANKENKLIIERFENMMMRMMSLDDDSPQKQVQNQSNKSKTKNIKKQKKPQKKQPIEQTTKKNPPISQKSSVSSVKAKKDNQKGRAPSQANSTSPTERKSQQRKQIKPVSEVNKQTKPQIKKVLNEQPLITIPEDIQFVQNRYYKPSKGLRQTYDLDYEYVRGQHNTLKVEGNFKIVRARINQEGSIEFEIRYDNGLSMWLDGNKLKAEHPYKVIRFYEQRISWGC